MAENPSPGNIFSRSKLNLVAIIVIAAAAVILIAFFVFRLSAGGGGPKSVSFNDALTMVAQATQSAVAEDSGSTNEPGVTKGASKAAPNQKTPMPARTSAGPAITAAGANSDLPVNPNPVLSQPTSDTGSNPQYVQGPTATYPVSNVTVRPTYTPKPSETRTPPNTKTPTITATATTNPGLKGLKMSDVTGRLASEKSFDCKQEGGASGVGITLWMCDYMAGNDLWYHVDLYGTFKTPVNNLLASVFQTKPDDTAAIEILGYIAGLNYTGSSPAAASDWVAQTLPQIKDVNDVREKNFGGVHFKLYGGPGGRYLEMGSPVQ